MRQHFLCYILGVCIFAGLGSCNGRDNLDYSNVLTPKLAMAANPLEDNSIGAQHNILLSMYLDYFESNTCPTESILHTMCGIAEPYMDCPESTWAEIETFATSNTLINDASSEINSNYVYTCINKCFEYIESSEKVVFTDIEDIVSSFIDELEKSNLDYNIYKENSLESAMLSTLKHSTFYWCSTSNMSHWDAIATHVNADEDLVLISSNKYTISKIIKADVYGAGIGFIFGPAGSVTIGSFASAYAAIYRD